MRAVDSRLRWHWHWHPVPADQLLMTQPSALNCKPFVESKQNPLGSLKSEEICVSTSVSEEGGGEERTEDISSQQGRGRSFSRHQQHKPELIHCINAALAVFDNPEYAAPLWGARNETEADDGPTPVSNSQSDSPVRKKAFSLLWPR